MNRITLAIIFILLTGLLCAGEYIYVKDTVDNYSEDLSRIEEALDEGDAEKALKIAKRSDRDWQKDSGRIDMLLFHDYVDDIGEDICTIKMHIEKENYDEAAVTCEKTKRELYSLFESEKPLAKNII